MNKIKQSVQKYSLNEDDMYHKIRSSKAMKQNVISKKKAWLSLGLATSLVLALISGVLFFNPLPKLVDYNQPISRLAYAMVSVDINPSFELYVDEDGLVVEVKALNEDAQSLDVSELVGLSAEEAVERIVFLAIEAGFIDPDDLDGNYVLVTTALLDEENENDEGQQNMDSLGYRIQLRLQENEDLDDFLKVSIIKATVREKFEAEGKQIPLGLYIVNGMIEVDGEMMPIATIMKSKENQEKLRNRGVVFGNDDDDNDDNDDNSNNNRPNPLKPNIPNRPNIVDRDNDDDDDDEG